MTKLNIERRTFIRNSGLTLAAGALIGGTSGQPRHSLIDGSKPYANLNGMDGYTVGHGDFKYQVDKNWGVQDVDKYPVAHCHEMVMDSNGRLIMCTTDVRNNILIYDKKGQVLSSWGTEFPGAHGLTLCEQEGEEFLFLTDTVRHQVFKTTLDGRILMTLDYPEEISAYTSGELYQPTETAIAENGDIYVADGYGLNYIIQYDATGNYIRHFGGKGDGKEQFQTPHGVCIDKRSGNPEILITSRSKQEFKRFSLDGQHLETISLPGCWICRPVIKGDNLYFAVIVTKSWWDYDGMVAVLDKDNRIVSLPGGSAPTYVDGILQEPEYDQSTFLNPHDVCVDDEDNIYVPQWYSGKTYPVKLKRLE